MVGTSSTVGKRAKRMPDTQSRLLIPKIVRNKIVKQKKMFLGKDMGDNMQLIN